MRVRNFATGITQTLNTGTLSGIGSAALATAMNAAYTVSIWGKPTTLLTSNGFFKDASGDKFWFNILSDNTVRIYHSDLSPVQTNTTVKITDREWHHYAATYDGSTIKIYIDSVLRASQAVTGTLSLSSTLTVPDAGVGYLGKFDEVRIWNRPLVQAEITQLYYSGIAPRNGLIREYLLDEGSGTTATDTSGSNVNATLSNQAYTTDVVMKLRTTS